MMQLTQYRFTYSIVSIKCTSRVMHCV